MTEPEPNPAEELLEWHRQAQEEMARKFMTAVQVAMMAEEVPQDLQARVLERLIGGAPGFDVRPSITCPRCGKSSPEANDIREGYCGNCHDWTSPPNRVIHLADKPLPEPILQAFIALVRAAGDVIRVPENILTDPGRYDDQTETQLAAAMDARSTEQGDKNRGCP